jgi:hypothetical protein
MSEPWNLYFPSYLIYDGWGHVHVGQDLVTSGVEFRSVRSLRRAEDQSKSAVPAPSFAYLVTAEVIFKSKEGCLIDFGLPAVGAPDLMPEGASVGEYVTGEIRLLVERQVALASDVERSVPRSIWHVAGITADLTPYIQHSDPTFAKVLVRDDSRAQYKQVQSTLALDQEMRIPTTTNVKLGFYLHCNLKVS